METDRHSQPLRLGCEFGDSLFLLTVFLRHFVACFVLTYFLSAGDEIRINIERDEEQIALTIKDDGVGIGGSKSDPISSSRLGMVGMRERLLQVGGNLEVVSWPDRGVLIQATVPTQPSD